MSFAIGILACSDSSSRLCHSPSLIAVKSFSVLKSEPVTSWVFTVFKLCRTCGHVGIRVGFYIVCVNSIEQNEICLYSCTLLLVSPFGSVCFIKVE